MSKATRKAVLEKVDMDSDKVWIMPNRIDVDLFSRRDNLEKFKELDDRFGKGKHILHVGRKEEQKNIDTVIKALSILGEEYKCVFIGRGDTKAYRELAESLNVSDRCYFVESVPNDELPEWYSWCDCMCTPSRWEGFGFVFIEAAACEAAIVTSNIGPMNEYLSSDSAILVDDYENEEAIANAIIRGTSNNSEIQEMRKKARLVALNFSKEEIDRKEIEIYRKVMNTKANNKKLSNLGIYWKYRNYR